MSDLIITCDRCKNEVTHICDKDLKKAVIDLLTFTPHFGMPEFLKRESKKAGFYDNGDDEVPVICETFLYPLLGKDDARTFMALLNHVLRIVGMDPNSVEIDRAIDAVIQARIDKKAENERLQKAYRERRAAREAEEKRLAMEAKAAKKKPKKKGK
jgi:hypothetical protein